jgi:LuxR family maltose regulon positive regulatory protein
MQEGENQLHQAAATYRRVLELAGDRPLPFASEAHLGLARVLYEWNGLDAAELHGQKSVQMGRQIEKNDRFIAGEVFLARLKLARGDLAGAAAILAEAGQTARLYNFVQRLPEVAAAQVLTLLRQGSLAAAAELAGAYELPVSQARVCLAQGDPAAALIRLEPVRAQMEARRWEDERLRVTVLQAVAHHAHKEADRALQLLGEALRLAEPGGCIRLFLDEGQPMARLLSEAASRGIMPEYARKLMAAFEAGPQKEGVRPASQPLVEPLSQREIEVLQLVASGLSNQEIGERLFLALSTVKGHIQSIFGKLEVQRRTEAIARARELGLL